MKQLVECVPNFSEGRRPDVIQDIVNEIQSVPGVRVLDQEMDKDHNRAVVTFIGEPEPVKQAAFLAIAKAAELIDMEKHKGEHPRLGATDVVPFVPISGVTMEDCIRLAVELGEQVGEKLQIPVYLYEEAATREDRRNLATIRKGEYEGLKKEIGTNPERQPDFGPTRTHPTAGAVVIGARFPLIAYNVYLGTKDLTIAKKIAAAIRYSSGGFRYVKALGFEIKERGIVQVSINLVNYLGTPMYRVFETIKDEAARYGVPVISSEIVGLTPVDALLDTAEYYLQLENFKKEQVLEKRLLEWEQGTKSSLFDFIDEVASSSPAPGGGSVAALVGSLGAALSSMVCNLTIGKKKYAQYESELKEILESSEQLRRNLEELIVRDQESFNQVMSAYKLPKNTATEQKRQKEIFQEALKRACLVPLEVMEKTAEILEISHILAVKGNQNAISDVATAVQIAGAASESAWYNVKINMKSIEDQSFVADAKQRGLIVRYKVQALVEDIVQMLEEKF
ncbi:MAG TPA: glutamate formimidoyltransferase [candidate division Zixibacteria bacterium]|nr:glutamate formimidoyltransferase [candidate division Zixibacteria bacterium]